MFTHGMNDMGGVDHSHLEKVVLARKVGIHFNTLHDDEERLSVLKRLAMVLVSDVSAIVRQTLAFELRRSAYVPREVAERIARDVEDVSAPFLKQSPSLTDDILLDLIPFLEEFALTAIARRDYVSQIISEKLAEFGGKKTLEALLGNANADMGEASYITIIDRFPKEHSLMDLMAQRDLLPMDIVARIMDLVSDKMIADLKSKYQISEDGAHAVAKEARDKGVAFMMDGASIQQLVNYARDMKISNELTAPFVLNMVRHGNKRFFVAAMAVLVDRDVDTIDEIVRQGGGIAIERLVKKAGFTEYYSKLFLEAL